MDTILYSIESNADEYKPEKETLTNKEYSELKNVLKSTYTNEKNMSDMINISSSIGKRINTALDSNNVNEDLLQNILQDFWSEMYGRQKGDNKEISLIYLENRLDIIHYKKNNGSIRDKSGKLNFGVRFIDRDNIYTVTSFIKEQNNISIKYKTNSKNIQKILGAYDNPNNTIQFRGEYEPVNTGSNSINSKFKFSKSDLRDIFNNYLTIDIENNNIILYDSKIKFENGNVHSIPRNNIESFSRATHKKYRSLHELKERMELITENTQNDVIETSDKYGHHHKIESYIEIKNPPNTELIPIFSHYKDNNIHGKLSHDFCKSIIHKINNENITTELYQLNRYYKLKPLEIEVNGNIILRVRDIKLSQYNRKEYMKEYFNSIAKHAVYENNPLLTIILLETLSFVLYSESSEYLSRIAMRASGLIEQNPIKNESKLIEYKSGHNIEPIAKKTEELSSDDINTIKNYILKDTNGDFTIIVWGVNDDNHNIRGISKATDDGVGMIENHANDADDSEVKLSKCKISENKYILAALVTRNKKDMSNFFKGF